MSAATGPILPSMEDAELKELASKVGDRYEIEAKPDGQVVLTPKLTWAAVRARHGLAEAKPSEFEELFGDLPTGPR
jgi:hypothetical protein